MPSKKTPNLLKIFVFFLLYDLQPFSKWKVCNKLNLDFTCSVLPSTQEILGGGTPWAEQERDPPVLLENPW